MNITWCIGAYVFAVSPQNPHGGGLLGKAMVLYVVYAFVFYCHFYFKHFVASNAVHVVAWLLVLYKHGDKVELSLVDSLCYLVSAITTADSQN